LENIHVVQEEYIATVPTSCNSFKNLRVRYLWVECI